MRTGTVLFYLFLAAVSLAPGLALWLVPDTPVGVELVDDSLRALAGALKDIRFGNGLRFWLGVSGATMMGLLLLYPIRKVLAKARFVGSIGGWFHIHIVFGIAGPVLVLYHCNFGLGGRNANVALWFMLAVAISGIIGHFIYASVSATFYSHRQRAQDQFEAIGATLARLDVLQVPRQKLMEALADFDTELLTPRRGVIASGAARWRLERQRRQLARRLSVHLAQCADQLHLDDTGYEQLRALTSQLYGAYIRIARSTSNRSLREQIWARWRLFHLPAFLIMAVATAFHVAAVWDMDPTKPEMGAQHTEAAQPALVAARISAEAVAPVTTAPAQAVGVRGQPHGPGTGPKPRALPTPPVAVAKPVAIAPLADAAEAPELRLPAAQNVPIRETAAAALPPQVRSEAYPPTIELDSRFKDSRIGALGGAKPRTLEDQIRAYQALKAAGSFTHSAAQTNYALKGRHIQVECADCHKASLLRETPQENPRACINCHKQDDVHHGRRPDCASCHMPSQWGQIARRK